MRVWLDPVRLAARAAHRRRRRRTRCASRTSTSPPAASATRRRARARPIRSACAPPDGCAERSEFENVIVKTARDGTLVRLGDVGSVGARRRNLFVAAALPGPRRRRLRRARPADGQRARRPARRRRRRWRGSRESFPPGLEYRIAFDTTTVVQESIAEVVETLAEAVGLVVLVMFVFLQSWRATLIPALTMPVSLIGAFAFVNLLGFSINTLTLFAIVLATGIVVDDAIVVIENIERHIQEYSKSPLQAASDAMREVFGAVIATALVLIAVFVPVAFFPGTTGRLYQQFALTIAFSVAISAFNALTLTPALSALLLRHGGLGSGWFFGPIERGIAAAHDVYVRGRPRAGARRDGWWWWSSSGCSALTYYVYTRVPQRVRAGGGRRLLHLDRAGAAGRVARVHDAASSTEAEKILLAAPEVESVFSILGFSFAGSAPNQGLIFTLLKPFEERQRPEQRDPGAAAAAARPAVRHPGRARHSRSRRPASTSATSAGSRSRCSIREAATDIQSLGNAVQALVGASQQSTQRRRALQLVHRQRSAAGRRHRSREGAEPRPADQRDHERDADLSRVVVRQRLRLQQPRLPRLRAGGQGVPIGPEGPRSVLRADDERADGAARPTSCACARRPRRR